MSIYSLACVCAPPVNPVPVKQCHSFSRKSAYGAHRWSMVERMVGRDPKGLMPSEWEAKRRNAVDESIRRYNAIRAAVGVNPTSVGERGARASMRGSVGVVRGKGKPKNIDCNISMRRPIYKCQKCRFYGQLESYGPTALERFERSQDALQDVTIVRIYDRKGNKVRTERVLERPW